MPRVFMRSICILLHSSVPKCSILLAGGTGGWKVSSVARGFSSIKIWLFKKFNQQNKWSLCIFQQNITLALAIFYWQKTNINFIYYRLFCCNHTCYCANMVSVTSASRYITPASRYFPRYQSRPLMYIRGLIPRNIAELAETVPIGTLYMCLSRPLMSSGYICNQTCFWAKP